MLRISLFSLLAFVRKTFLILFDRHLFALRPHFVALVRELQKWNVPITILSAGMRDTILELFRQQGAATSNCFVLANYLVFSAPPPPASSSSAQSVASHAENAPAVAVLPSPPIHSFNKGPVEMTCKSWEGGRQRTPWVADRPAVFGFYISLFCGFFLSLLSGRPNPLLTFSSTSHFRT